MIETVRVSTARQRRDFLRFPEKLYKGNPYYTPPLYMDERKIFRKDFIYNDTCDAVYFNAYRDGAMAGRISGIIQKAANEKNGEKRVRFSRFEAIEDFEVARQLFEAVEAWAREKGMDTACGPLSFSDLEREGLLVGGYEYPATFEETWNPPYYGEFIEKLGYKKEVDWTGSKLLGPESEEVMQEMEDLNTFIFKRYKLHFGPSKSGKDFMKRYAKGVFDLIDKSYEGLYGTVPFTDGMRKLMMENYTIAVNPKYVAIILDENEKPICFGLAFPSFTRALVGTRGRFTPKVLWGMLRCLTKPEIIDLGLIGVDPEYMNRGISAALSVAIMHMLRDNKNLKWADTNLNLEDNWAIQNQWKRFNRIVHKRYRAYVKPLNCHSERSEESL